MKEFYDFNILVLINGDPYCFNLSSDFENTTKIFNLEDIKGNTLEIVDDQTFIVGTNDSHVKYY